MKALRTVAIVAGVVAIAATGAGLILGAGAMVAGVSLTTVAAVASTVSAVASMGSQLLTKPPDMKGSVNQVLIGNNLPVMYCMGRSYSGGGLVYEDSNGTNNKDRTQIMAHTVGGPIDSFESFQGDYTTMMSASGGLLSGAVSGWYSDFLWVDSRRGLKPETALSSPAGRASFRNRTSASKLSGIAATAVTMKFDKDGKRYSGGIPQWGIVAKWVKVYDPRLDSTYPGGSGAHRFDDDTTWAWSENPALHALTYARGRFENELKIVGAGIPADALDLAKFVELANICDANGWTIGGTVYEGPGISKWDNLKRILVTAAAEPVWVGGMLSLKVTAPKVALDTITSDDVLGDIEITAMTGWKDRINTIIPRSRSELHRWEYMQGEAVTSATYLTEDGETKTEEFQFDLCQDKDQAAELAAYMLCDRREFRPVTITCKPRLFRYRPGDALEIDIPDAGLIEQLFTVLSREVDPATGAVTFTLESETSAKHAFALGRTGVLPPTPSLWTPEDVDTVNGDALAPDIATSYPVGLTLTAHEDGGVTISSHTRRFSDGRADIAVTGTTLTSTGLVAGDGRYIAYDDPDLTGGAVTYALYASSPDARVSSTNPDRFFIGYVEIPTLGSGDAGGVGGDPPGGACVTVDTPVLLEDGSTVAAGELAVGDKLLTRDEATLKWGVYPIEALEIVGSQPVLKATISGTVLRATPEHQIYLATGWTKMSDVPGAVADGTASVVKMTVTGAHTYVSNGILSHNIKGF